MKQILSTGVHVFFIEAPLGIFFSLLLPASLVTWFVLLPLRNYYELKRMGLPTRVYFPWHNWRGVERKAGIAVEDGRRLGLRCVDTLLCDYRGRTLR